MTTTMTEPIKSVSYTAPSPVVVRDWRKLARSRMRRMLTGFDELEIVGEAENGAAAIALIEAERPCLIFLDVQTPDPDGVEVLKLLETDPMPLVVFVTAFDQYAVNTFEVSTLDYLLKPVHRARLQRATRKAREKLTGREESGQQLSQFLKTQRSPTTQCG